MVGDIESPRAVMTASRLGERPRLLNHSVLNAIPSISSSDVVMLPLPADASTSYLLMIES